jgi:hypothetical protein
VLTFTRDGSRLFSQANEQPQMEIFPEGERAYFAKSVDAEVTFDVDGRGRATGVVLHQGGHDMMGRRLDAETAARIAAALAAGNKRFRLQVPKSGGDTLLRKVLERDREGKPNYEDLSRGFADFTRQQLPAIQETLKGLGALTSVTFKEVTAAGADSYRAAFEHGSAEFAMFFDADGKIDSVAFRPLN